MPTQARAGASDWMTPRFRQSVPPFRRVRTTAPTRPRRSWYATLSTHGGRDERGGGGYRRRRGRRGGRAARGRAGGFRAGGAARGAGAGHGGRGAEAVRTGGAGRGGGGGGGAGGAAVPTGRGRLRRLRLAACRPGGAAGAEGPDRHRRAAPHRPDRAASA